jgi:Phage capsid protein
MSSFVTEAFVQQYSDNFMHVAQQKTSRLEGSVSVETGIKGMSKSINRLGQRTATRRTVRHADTPINDQPHSTRYVDLFDWDDGDMIDDQDKVRMLVDPTSEYVTAMVSSLNRAKDDVIITALGGNSRSTTGNIALPAAQKIAVGGTGLTKAKLFATRALFRKNECDEEAGEELYMLYNSTALTDILAETNFTSADYTALNMIQNGTVNGKWMGFTWIPIERCPKVSTTRFLYAYAKSGVKLGIGENIVTRVAEDPGKGFNVRTYAKMSLGSVRIEEEKVVEIACLDP